MNNESASHERDASERILTTTRDITADCSGNDTTRERCKTCAKCALIVRLARRVVGMERRLRRIESRLGHLEAALEAHLAAHAEVE
jgi:hypothetical protein